MNDYRECESRDLCDDARNNLSAALAEIARLCAVLIELLWCAENLQETDSDRFIAAISSARTVLNGDGEQRGRKGS